MNERFRKLFQTYSTNERMNDSLIHSFPFSGSGCYSQLGWSGRNRDRRSKEMDNNDIYIYIYIPCLSICLSPFCMYAIHISKPFLPLFCLTINWNDPSSFPSVYYPFSCLLYTHISPLVAHRFNKQRML